MKRILPACVIGLLAVACAVESGEEALGVGEQGAVANVNSAKKRADGNFDVECDDGTKEVRTSKEILSDQVCLGGIDAGPVTVTGDLLEVPAAAGKEVEVDVITSAAQTGIVPSSGGQCGTNFYTDQKPYALVTLKNSTAKRAIVSLWSAPSAGGSDFKTSMALYKTAPTTLAEVQGCIGVAAAKCESSPCSLDQTYAASYEKYTLWAGHVSGDNRPVDLAPGESVVVRVASLNGTGFFTVHAQTDALLPALGSLDGVLEVDGKTGGVVSAQIAASAAKTGIVPSSGGTCGTNFYTDTESYSLVKLTNPTSKRAIVSVWTGPIAEGSDLKTSMALYKTIPTTLAEVQACIGVAAAKCESSPCSLDQTYAASYEKYTLWAGHVSGDNRPVDLAPGESIFVRIGALNGTGLFTINAQTDLLK